MRQGLPALAWSLALALALWAGEAFGVPVNIGPYEGVFDSSLSWTARWSTQAADAAHVGAAAGGRAVHGAADDWRLGFERGDLVWHRLEGEHALELRREDNGLYLRGRYWRTFEPDITGDGAWPRAAREQGAEWLDAFFFLGTRWGEQPGTLRIGRQRLFWGESRLFEQGIDSLNPLDEARAFGPVADRQAAARPLGMLHVHQSLGDRLAVEGFHALEWQPDLAEGCGRFAARDDVSLDGCDRFDTGVPATAAMAEVARAQGVGYRRGAQGVGIPIAGGGEPGAAGQYGLALHGFGETLSGALYYVQLHARRPYIGFEHASEAVFADLPAALAVTDASLGGGLDAAGRAALLAQQRQAVLQGNARFTRAYPESIALWGASLNGWLPGGLRWAGELSYRPDAPLQVDPQVLLGRLEDAALAGQVDPGYRRRELYNARLRVERRLDGLPLADAGQFEAELGGVRIGGLGPPGGALRFAELAGQPYTRSAWGYRLRGELTWRDRWPRVDLTPSLAFAHDVNGTGPGGQFVEGARAVALGLAADYLETYRVAVGYTAFFGREADWRSDRDFAELRLSVRF